MLAYGCASLLAGLVKAPSDFNPTIADGLTKALDRRNNYVLVNMVKMGSITWTALMFCANSLSAAAS